VLSSDSEGYVVNTKRGRLLPPATATAREVVVDFPAPLFRETERVVAEIGASRSNLIWCAVKQYLEAQSRKRLEQELAAGYVANSGLDRRIAEEFSAVDHESFY
jgi:metal-responsive CopG/Arc/MetJ family transcriptional regulator